ncbi:MAG: hypothetical protein EPN30_08615 [Actinomycetota bacterium]|nr:MAG: hypothetical protein EPN30_08615 [Actinomycetota bacterium]
MLNTLMGLLEALYVLDDLSADCDVISALGTSGVGRSVGFDNSRVWAISGAGFQVIKDPIPARASRF